MVELLILLSYQSNTIRHEICYIYLFLYNNLKAQLKFRMKKWWYCDGRKCDKEFKCTSLIHYNCYQSIEYSNATTCVGPMWRRRCRRYYFVRPVFPTMLKWVLPCIFYVCFALCVKLH
jgi:hypothetical protein